MRVVIQENYNNMCKWAADYIAARIKEHNNGAEKDRPFVYTRGSAICAVNPANKALEVRAHEFEGKSVVYSIGSVLSEGDRLKMGEGSFAIMK